MNQEQDFCYGFSIESDGICWSVNGYRTRDEAIKACASLAERDGMKFRKYWWQFWAQKDPREAQ